MYLGDIRYVGEGKEEIRRDGTAMDRFHKFRVVTYLIWGKGK